MIKIPSYPEKVNILRKRKPPNLKFCTHSLLKYTYWTKIETVTLIVQTTFKKHSFVLKMGPQTEYVRFVSTSGSEPKKGDFVLVSIF